MEDRREKLKEKMTCKNKRHGERGMEILARCDKLWMKKRERNQERDQEETRTNCGEQKDEEILKFRKHQYNENPGMSLCGEDVQIVMECDEFGPV